MYNYYDYCKAISENYYPKIYTILTEHIIKVCEECDKNKYMHPFPTQDKFKELVDNVHESYTREFYRKFAEGENTNGYYRYYEDYLLKDIIKILLVEEILKRRKKYKNYPYFY